MEEPTEFGGAKIVFFGMQKSPKRMLKNYLSLIYTKYYSYNKDVYILAKKSKKEPNKSYIIP